MNKVIFWDFHSTLAYWEKMYGSSLKMVLDKHGRGKTITKERLRELIIGCFPWHKPNEEYFHLRQPEAWWENAYKIFKRAYTISGITPEKAYLYAKEARKYLVSPEYYTLYSDTEETLKYFNDNGYRNIILSNHIPELKKIVKSLGIMKYIDICISSANVGLEKPNPKIFHLALEMAGNPDQKWMVGDNLKVDVCGAEAAGIKAVLVRRTPKETVQHYSEDLAGLKEIIV